MDIQLLCKNCGHESNENFCSHCGQKRIGERWELKQLLRSAFTTLFNIEKGFFYTFRELFFHPGKVVHEYLGGRTIPYTNPFRYVVIAIAISVFLMLSLGVWEFQVDYIIEGYKKFEVIDSEQGEADMRANMKGVTRFMNIMPLLLLPFIAFAARLFLGKKRLHYAEYFIMVAYLTAQSTLYGILLTISVYLYPPLVTSMFVIGVLIATVVYGQAFRELFDKNWGESLALALATYVVGFIFFFVFAFILGIILGIILIAGAKLIKG
ncbi:MAG: DUF3667 domain-containing protein [Bacteroidota bacterium]